MCASRTHVEPNPSLSLIGGARRRDELRRSFRLLRSHSLLLSMSIKYAS